VFLVLSQSFFARKGAWAMFLGVRTHKIKNIEFKSYEKITFIFLLTVATAHGTLFFLIPYL